LGGPLGVPSTCFDLHDIQTHTRGERWTRTSKKSCWKPRRSCSERLGGPALELVVGLLFDSKGVTRVLYAAAEAEDVIDLLSDAEELLDDGERLGMTTIQVDVSLVEAQWKREGGELFESDDFDDGDWDVEDWDEDGEE